jgi:peptide/nickel transport system permease protein
VNRQHAGRRPAIAAVALLGAMLVLAIPAPIVAPYGFDVIDLAHRRAAPSVSHWFGTDEIGRDLLTRLIYGARVSLSIGIVSAVMSAAVGVTVGAVAGYAGGWVDDALMRVTDAMLSVPRLPLLMIAAAVIEPECRRWWCLSVLPVGWRWRASFAPTCNRSKRATSLPRRARWGRCRGESSSDTCCPPRFRRCPWR